MNVCEDRGWEVAGADAGMAEVEAAGTVVAILRAER